MGLGRRLRRAEAGWASPSRRRQPWGPAAAGNSHKAALKALLSEQIFNHSSGWWEQ